jgi:3D (Asp-Asp-Asp) domain-containing protein
MAIVDILRRVLAILLAHLLLIGPDEAGPVWAKATEFRLAAFEVSAYAPFDDPVGMCSDGSPETTATGTRPTAGRTIAVDPKVIPYGTWVWIDGWGWRRAEDTGSLVTGDRIDVMVDKRDEALTWGRRDTWVIYVIPKEKK